MKREAILLPAVLLAALAMAPCRPAAATPAEDRLRAAWVGRWVVLRSSTLSNCDERYTNNRMRGPQPSSGGRHRFDPGELGRVDNVNLQRARIDLLVSLVEPLRVELRDGPFQLFEQLDCRVELELPTPRSAVRQGDEHRLQETIRGFLEGHPDRAAAVASATWNRRRVEPLPADHEERWAAYHSWKQEQLYLALRDRLAQALDRVVDLAGKAGRSAAYARGLASGANDYDRWSLSSTDCDDLPTRSFSPDRKQAPKELDKQEEEDWKDGYVEGQLLLFEVELARRIERCLP